MSQNRQGLHWYEHTCSRSTCLCSNCVLYTAMISNAHAASASSLVCLICLSSEALTQFFLLPAMPRLEALKQLPQKSGNTSTLPFQKIDPSSYPFHALKGICYIGRWIHFGEGECTYRYALPSLKVLLIPSWFPNGRQVSVLFHKGRVYLERFALCLSWIACSSQPCIQAQFGPDLC